MPSWPAANATSSVNAPAAGTTPIDLSQSINRVTLARQIKADIDAWCVEHFDDGHRKHLGASLIGRECSRELWYTFRWVKHTIHSGRQYRLFNRGHLEEARFVQYLEGIGAKVEWFDSSVPMTLLWHPESDSYRYVESAKLADGREPMDDLEVDVTDVREPKSGMHHTAIAYMRKITPEYPQIRIEGVGGHFGGSMDAKITLPEKYGVGPLVFVNEFKTHNDKSFDKLVADSVAVAKYEHFCQMSIYGYKLGMKYGIYCAVNKNNDELQIEIVPLDWQLAQRLENKAERIIGSPTPPEKIAQTITFKKCSYCDYSDVCHQGRAYEKNCRSCMYAQPVADKKWWCHGWSAEIPAEAIPHGCENWKPAV